MRQNSYVIVLGMLFAVFFPSATPKKYHVHFGVMHCLGTEDFGDDEIYIWRYQDGSYQSPELTWNGASKGDYHHFKSYSTFDSKLELYVYERDDPGFDDAMGYIKIDSSTIDAEFVTINPYGYGYYTLTWTNLTPYHDSIKSNHQTMSINQPTHATLTSYGSNSRNAKARQAHQSLKDHLNTGNRGRETHKAIRKAVHTFKKTTDTTERQKAVDEVKEAINFNPFRGIVQNIIDKKWPTVILYAPTAAVNFGFASANVDFGIALELNSAKAGLVVAFNMDVGITIGDEGKIGVGVNRNTIDGVAGWTYRHTIPADAEVTGGITFSYDLALTAPNLQEVVFTWGPLPAGASVGYAYTALKGNF